MSSPTYKKRMILSQSSEVSQSTAKTGKVLCTIWVLRRVIPSSTVVTFSEDSVCSCKGTKAFGVFRGRAIYALARINILSGVKRGVLVRVRVVLPSLDTRMAADSD